MIGHCPSRVCGIWRWPVRAPGNRSAAVSDRTSSTVSPAEAHLRKATRQLDRWKALMNPRTAPAHITANSIGMTVFSFGINEGGCTE